MNPNHSKTGQTGWNKITTFSSLWYVIYMVLNTPDNPSPDLPWSSYIFIYFSEIFNQCLNENGELVSGVRQLGSSFSHLNTSARLPETRRLKFYLIYNLPSCHQRE